jgi:hypothetical protein
MTKCQYCGQNHEFRCPQVKAIEYFENGTVKRVEFYTFADNCAPMIIPTHSPYNPNRLPDPYYGPTFGPNISVMGKLSA